MKEEAKVLYKITAYDSDFIKELPDKARTLDGGTIYYYYDFKKHRYLSNFVSDDFDIYDEIKNLQSQLKAKEEVIKEAREYIEKRKHLNWYMESCYTNDLLEILSKGENK